MIWLNPFWLIHSSLPETVEHQNESRLSTPVPGLSLVLCFYIYSQICCFLGCDQASWKCLSCFSGQDAPSSARPPTCVQ